MEYGKTATIISTRIEKHLYDVVNRCGKINCYKIKQTVLGTFVYITVQTLGCDFKHSIHILEIDSLFELSKISNTLKFLYI